MGRPDDERKQELSALLKRARKGAGVYAEDREDLPKLLGLGGLDELKFLFRVFPAVAGESPASTAISFALGFSLAQLFPTLTERRKLACDYLKVSMRTVMRLEDDGLEELVDFLVESQIPSSGQGDRYAWRAFQLTGLALRHSEGANDGASEYLQEAEIALGQALSVYAELRRQRAGEM